MAWGTGNLSEPESGKRLESGGTASSAPLQRVTTVAELQEVGSWYHVLLGRPEVRLRLPGLDTEMLHKGEMQINQELSACGCKQAAFCALGGVTAWIIYAVLHGSHYSGKWTGSGMVIAVLIAGIVLGKMVRRARAYWLVNRIIRRISLDIDQQVRGKRAGMAVSGGDEDSSRSSVQF